MRSELQAVVQEMLDKIVAAGEEVGLQAAAYVDGELVVDAWSGVADEATGRRVDGDTLFTVWSTTKGFIATAIHILADRNRLEYDTAVAEYWPEFAQNGKEAVTVRHLLTHTAGVPQMPEGVTPEMMTDWDAMCSAIASHAPLWTPGTKVCYHAWTFGWLLGEIIRRVDGRPVERFVQEELCRPLGINDFYLGIPDEVEGRIAPLRQTASHLAGNAQHNELAQLVGPPQVTTAEVVNRPDFRRAVVPGGGGIMNARAIARHYAMLAHHGELDGIRILSPDRVDMMRALQTDAPDEMSGLRARRGLGYGLSGEPGVGGSILLGRAEGAFGHDGNGGSLGFADPARNFAFGLTKNLMTRPADPKQITAYRVAEAIREQLDGNRVGS
jgi:CubicO group peptidase (beta-lactamase class C family)